MLFQQPAYTEPSAEVHPYLESRGEWVEMGGSGIFRPEVTLPVGVTDRVLAWGLPCHFHQIPGLGEHLEIDDPGMHTTDRPYIVTVPCDSPFIPVTLVERLYCSLVDSSTNLSVAHDGTRLQPMFALLRCELLSTLLAYLDEGGRKVDTWYQQQRLAIADFSDTPDTFLNLNSPEDKSALESRMPGS